MLINLINSSWKRLTVNIYWLTREKTLKWHLVVIIVVRAVFHENNKYYPQVFI